MVGVMISVLIGVVLFSKKPRSSDTLNSLLSIDFDNLGVAPCLYIRDNSLNGFDFRELKEQFRGEVVIVHDGVNLALSKVYNAIVAYPINSDLLLFLDDDSMVDENYIKNMLIFHNSDYEVAVPLIEHSSQLISPGKIVGVKGLALSQKNLAISSGNNNLVAMMSGTVVKRSIFDYEKIEFNEKLTFYGVDTRFFLDCQKKGKRVYVLDYLLFHDSALRSKTFEVVNMLNRLSNLMKAQFYIFDQRKFYKVMLFFYFPVFIFGKVVRLKHLSFLKLFKNYKYFWRLDD